MQFRRGKGDDDDEDGGRGGNGCFSCFVFSEGGRFVEGDGILVVAG